MSLTVSTSVTIDDITLTATVESHLHPRRGWLATVSVNGCVLAEDVDWDDVAGHIQMRAGGFAKKLNANLRRNRPARLAA